MIPYIVFTARRSSPLSFSSFLDLNNPDRPANRPSKKAVFTARLHPNSMPKLSSRFQFRGPLGGLRQAFQPSRALVCPYPSQHMPRLSRIRAYHTFFGIGSICPPPLTTYFVTLWATVCSTVLRRTADGAESCLKWAMCVNPHSVYAYHPVFLNFRLIFISTYIARMAKSLCNPSIILYISCLTFVCLIVKGPLSESTACQ
jgi:hypothetical protein